MTSVASSVAPERRFAGWAVILLAGGLLAGVVAGSLATSGRAALVLALAVVFVPIVLWRRPALGPVLVVGTALTIEQFPEGVGDSWVASTARIPLFHGFGGVRPSDVVLAFLLVLAASGIGGRVVVGQPRSPLGTAMLALLAAVLFGFGLGISTNGALSVASNEARPFLYLPIAFLVGATLINERRAIRPVLWAFVICTGFKAAQGTVLFLAVRKDVPRPEEVLAHEEALFFALFMLLTLALWVYDMPGALRRTATALLPLVVAADMGNSRRVAWVMLGVGLMVVLVVGWVSLKPRRAVLGRIAIALALVSAVYFPVYWNRTGGLANPATAVRSLVTPHSSDLSSDLYRVQEDANLRYNIARAGPLGKGFGHRIDYALPIVDISDIDPYIAYIPHNGVWYVFLRIGVLGAVAFWATLGLGLVSACRLARCADREFAVVGMLIASALPAYVVLGHVDQGFSSIRVALVMGALLGLGEAARRLVARGG